MVIISTDQSIKILHQHEKRFILHMLPVHYYERQLLRFFKLAVIQYINLKVLADSSSSSFKILMLVDCSCHIVKQKTSHLQPVQSPLGASRFSIDCAVSAFSSLISVVQLCDDAIL